MPARASANFENLITGAGADTITGTGGANVIRSGGGADNVGAGAGNDIVEGGAAGDTLDGGADIDTLDYSSSNAGVTVSLASNTASGGHATGDIISNFENVIGSASTDQLTGNGGANILNGGGSADTMTGGGGDDFYFVDVANDVVIETAGGGSDRVLASASYVLVEGVSVELFTTSDNLATTSISLLGNSLSQTIFGNAGFNILDGGGGGDGMVGLGGDDFYYVHTAGDRVVEAAGGGNDRIFALASFTLEAGSEVERITTNDNFATTAINLTGNNLSQFIYGNAGSNILDGGGGGDVLVGLDGDDFYYIRNVADRVVEAAGGGSDRIFAAASFALEAGSEVEKFTTVDNVRDDGDQPDRQRAVAIYLRQCRREHSGRRWRRRRAGRPRRRRFLLYPQRRGPRGRSDWRRQ